MQAITQREILLLISEINTFIDEAEELIRTQQEAYEKNKDVLLEKNRRDLYVLDETYKANCDAINRNSRKIINDAKAIQKEIRELDERLLSVDRYYVKAKKKKEAILSGATSDKYNNSSDYFETFEQIKENFQVLSKKYSEDILPGLINGINYLFSNQRKKDYEELIILQNTVDSFVKEMEEVLIPVTQENLSALKSDYFAERSALIEKQKNSVEDYENSYLDSLDKVAGTIYEKIDEVLPDEFVEYLYDIMANYGNSFLKVNSSSKIQDNVLTMCYFDYPVDFFVQSKAVSDVIKEKCSTILVNNAIRLPVILSVKDAPVWLIENDNSNAGVPQAFIHSVMFGMLSSCPVARLKYSAVDPENRGNSISPYFDAKQKLPELFGEKIYISKEEISEKINKLNYKIENILQNRLGNQYEDIFEYAKANSDFKAESELLLLYDFPKGFSERTLAELRNILRNGSKCGIYTIISYVPDPQGHYTMEYKRALQSVIELTTVLQQNGQSLICRGLPLVYYRMPERFEFARFFSTYMLIYEGMKNKGISFLPFIKKLIETKNITEVDRYISEICDLGISYEKNYVRVPMANAAFEPVITLGSVMYPADVFSDSVGYDRILNKFGVKYDAGMESSEFVELPLAFDLNSSFNMLLSNSEANNHGMFAFTHHLIWRFLSSMPVTKVNVCVFDGEQHGNSIMPFLDFRKRSPETFDQKIYTNRDAMCGRLMELNEYIDEFIQEKLGYRYTDIFEYNRQASSQTEPITLLILYDFPSGMDGRSLDLLMNILRNGNKCGIFTVICHNPEVTFSRYESIEERIEQISKYCVSIDYREGSYWLLPYNLPVNIPQPLSAHEIDAFVSKYLDAIEGLKNKSLSFKDILAKELFSLDSSGALRVPVGIGTGDSVVEMCFGEGSSHHGLIAGATGSGKSTLLHTIIMSSMLHYSPEQLHLYLMDFKSGTEFKIYESKKLPHIQLLALDAMQEFGESILENLVEEMESRANAFKDAGGVTKIKDYTAVTGKAMPRILVIMDEFQILFNDAANRKVAMHCAELTKRIVTEGRAFGIHLLMATQSTKVISELTLSHGTIEQMRIRVGLKSGENDARYLFSTENDTKALAMMKGPIGTAVMNPDYTERSNIGFRTAYCDDETQKYYLDLISETYADYASSIQIFEGSRTTALTEYFQKEKIGRTGELPVKIHMGTMIKVAPPFSVLLDKKRKHNLLVCGANEKMANTITDNYMISALLNKHVTVYCMDGDHLVGEDTSEAMYAALHANCLNFYFADTRGDMIRFINEAYKKYVSWKKQNSDEIILFVIKNLPYLDIVKSMLKGERVDESEYAEEEVLEMPEESLDPFAAINNMFASRNSDDDLSVGEKLIKMIGDGSGYGIHFVISSLEYQTVRECMYYGENVLSKFPERMIFALNANDAGNLIDNVSVSGLRDNTVYFTDGVKYTFQMKPYVTPKSSELQQIFDFTAPKKEQSRKYQQPLLFLSRL